jgi:hypothetical protein
MAISKKINPNVESSGNCSINRFSNDNIIINFKQMKKNLEPEEIRRIKDWWEGDIKCISCNKNIHLWYNGGELDEKECCGYEYRTVIQQIDLIISKIKQ